MKNEAEVKIKNKSDFSAQQVKAARCKLLFSQGNSD